MLTHSSQQTTCIPQHNPVGITHNWLARGAATEDGAPDASGPSSPASAQDTIWTWSVTFRDAMSAASGARGLLGGRNPARAAVRGVRARAPTWVGTGAADLGAQLVQSPPTGPTHPPRSTR